MAATRGRHRSISRIASTVVRAAIRVNGAAGKYSTSAADAATTKTGRASSGDSCARAPAENDAAGSSYARVGSMGGQTSHDQPVITTSFVAQAELRQAGRETIQTLHHEAR